MNWLRNFLISTNARPMAYRRHDERRFWIVFGVTLLCLAIAIVLGLHGVI